jgi:hypothetical protein
MNFRSMFSQVAAGVGFDFRKGEDGDGCKSTQNNYRGSKGPAKEVHDLRGLGAATQETRPEILFEIRCSE